MKKIYTVALAVLLLSFSQRLQAQLLSESFEGTFPPTSWTLINAGPSPNSWNQYSSAVLSSNGLGTAQDGNFIAGYLYNATNPANAWLISPAVNLTAGTNYALTFYYRVASASYPEKMKVTVGNAATVAAQTNTLWDNAGGTELTNTGWAQAIVNYTPTTTGNFYFGFHAYSEPDRYLLMLDNIKLNVAAGAPPVCVTNISPANGATNVGAPNLTLSWNAATGADSYDVYISTTNPPATPLTNVSGTSVTLTGAPYNTTFYWYVVPKNTAGAATGCETNITSFTTVAAPPVPANDEVCSAIPLTLNGASNCQNTASATSTGDPNLPGTSPCSAPNNTVWYTYTPAVSGTVMIKMERVPGANANLNAWLAFYTATGSCPTLTLTPVGDCIGANLATNNEVMASSPTLTAGTTYYIMIDGNSGATGEFCISLEDVPAPPANDECATAINITPYDGTVAGTSMGATGSAGIPDCSSDPGTPNDDVWYMFTAVQNGSATISVTGDANFDGVLQAFSGTCGSLTQFGNCVDDVFESDTEVMTLPGLVAGQTYYLRVYDWYNRLGSSFTITVSGDALPVTLANLKGTKSGNRNVLSWTTHTEQNNAGFEVERSVDGRTFSSIGFVASKAERGNSNASIEYEFTDRRPFASTNYYRLKQIDIDGKTTYSNVVVLKGEDIRSLTISNVYPNPAKDKINLVMSTQTTERINVMITDLAGKVVKQTAFNLVSGENNVVMDVNNLPSGTYMIKALCANGCENVTSKFVKQ